MRFVAEETATGRRVDCDKSCLVADGRSQALAAEVAAGMERRRSFRARGGVAAMLESAAVANESQLLLDHAFAAA